MAEAPAGGRPIVADTLARHPLLAALFPSLEPLVLSRAGLRPRRPFAGRLFRLLRELAAASPAATLNLVVPIRWLAAGEAPEAAWVGDHVNLEVRGPLTGRWPAGVPRTFPVLAGVYHPPQHQPRLGRGSQGPRVYSGIVVAGVTDVHRLTPFESQAAVAAGCKAVADCLVAPVILAAYYGLPVAACGMVQVAGAQTNEGSP